jgi:hypothetical protein
MTKFKKDKSIVEDVETQTKSTIDSVVVTVLVTALDPIYVERGQLSYGFIVTLDGVTYTFRTNTQGQLQLNNSGIFNTHFTLN